MQYNISKYKNIKKLVKNKKTEDFQHLFNIFVYFCR